MIKIKMMTKVVEKNLFLNFYCPISHLKDAPIKINLMSLKEFTV